LESKHNASASSIKEKVSYFKFEIADRLDRMSFEFGYDDKFRGIRNGFFKAVPKLLVSLTGVLLYAVTVNWIGNGDLRGLLINIAASLISIPVIFLCYDIWQDRSKRRVNEFAYEKVFSMVYEHIEDIEEICKVIMNGMMCYFRCGWAIYDDADASQIKVRMTNYGKTRMYAEEEEDFDFGRFGFRGGDDENEHAYVNPDYSDEDYEEDMFRIADEEEYADGIYGFDKDTIVPYLIEQRYLGYQIYGLSFNDIYEEEQKILRNTFIMDRLDEDQLYRVLRLFEAVEHLNAFMLDHGYDGDLFLKLDGYQVKGLVVRRESGKDDSCPDTAKEQSREPKSAEKASVNKDTHAPTGTTATKMEPEYKLHDHISVSAYSLWYKDEELEKNLDFDFLVDTPESAVNAVYMLNPEYLIYFGDLITDVLSRIRDVTNEGLPSKRKRG